MFKEVLGMTDDKIAEALIEGGITTTDADLPEIKASARANVRKRVA